MNQNNSLFNSVTFWMILIIGSFLSIKFAIDIYIVNPLISECYPFYNAECQQILLNTMKLPILTLTATATLVSLWALVFRSQQTAIQIDLTLQNNMYSHYLSHKSEFIEVLSYLEKTFSITFINPHGLYRRIFPNNNSNYWSPDSTENYLDKINQKHLNFIFVLKDYESLQNHIKDDLNDVYDQIHSLGSELYFSFEPELEFTLNPYHTLRVCNSILNALHDFSNLYIENLSPELEQILISEKLIFGDSAN